jgi:hypothetical protein
MLATQTEVSGFVNALQAVGSKLPREEPIKFTVRRIVRGTADDGEPMYVIRDVGELNLTASRRSTYPSRIGKLSNEDDPVAILTDLAENGPDSEAWQKAPDARVWEIAAAACAALQTDGNNTLWLSRALTVALAARRGATVTMRQLP